MGLHYKLFEKDFLKDNNSYEFIKKYRSYPIYKSLDDGKFHCETDNFQYSAETIDEIMETIDVLLGTKPLFVDLDLYSIEASELSKEAGQAIKGLISEWCDKGYKVIEIEHIIICEVDRLCSYERIKKSAEVKNGRRWKRLKKLYKGVNNDKN